MSQINKKRVLVAMSGGVDSSVCAYLLAEKGYQVVGVTIKTWSSDECRDEKSKGCCSIRDIDDARSVARKLGIPYYVMDLSADFKNSVIDYFVGEYLDGRTPNPCIECNNHIKFGLLKKKARELEADWIATGHYARKGFDPEERRYHVREAVDISKDQSYVLFGLNQDQLSGMLLPIGELEKKKVRALAEKLGLRVFDKPDSQEICFVKTHYTDFMKQAAPDRVPGKGQIVKNGGEVVGEHDGFYQFTIGQRKHIGVQGQPPYFVTSIDAGRNRVTIGTEEDLKTAEIVVRKVNWQLAPRLGAAQVKIRSRHPKAAAEIVSLDPHEVRIRFRDPQKAVAPGQAAVFYDQDRVMGGGWIEKAMKNDFALGGVAQPG